MPTTSSGIYYSAKGQGVPLLFVHGSGGDHTTWGYQMKDLSKDHQVIMLDLNGNGKSISRDIVGINSYVQDVLDVVEDLNRPVFLLGHSLGGAIAQQTALAHPEILIALGLIGTGAKLKVHQDILNGIENDFEATALNVAKWEFSRNATEEQIQAARDQMVQNGRDAFRKNFHTCNQFDVVDQISKIQVPTLVICGKEDKLTPVKYSEFLESSIENSVLELIDNAGHNVMLEQPVKVNEAVRQFASEL
jgi:pimeloyl-ACP methyl ester carboxylesterase